VVAWDVRHTEAFTALIDTLKVVVATLREKQVPFAIGGSLAAWARGGPEPQNDLDLMLKPQDAEAALAVLTEAGMRPSRPPEEWLFKAWNGDVMIDLIFCPSGLEISDDVLQRADIIPVMAVATPVMALEDMLVTMLCALGEHALDYSALLGIARSLREQINWSQLRARTDSSPYAKAFFTLVEELGVAPSRASGQPAAPSRVRVLSGAG
jgi:Uncharacterised nucleotidyltransferase